MTGLFLCTENVRKLCARLIFPEVKKDYPMIAARELQKGE